MYGFLFSVWEELNLEKKWAYEPGEQPTKKNASSPESYMTHLHGEFVEKHLAKSDVPKTLVTSDGQEIIYFIALDKDYVRQSVEVAMFDGDKFNYLPHSEAKRLSDKYFEYIEVLNELLQYAYTDGEWE